MLKLKLITGCLVLSGGIAFSVFAAEIPIEDLSSNPDHVQTEQVPSETPKQNFEQATPVANPKIEVNSAPLTLEQKVAKLEQQMVIQTDTTNKVDLLQEQIQKLQGDLDTEKHDIEQLQQQVKSFYQDLDQRLSNQNKETTNLPSPSEKNQADSPKKTLTDVEQDSYQAGLDAIKNKKYQDAINKLQSYLKTYPDGKYVVNTHYWLGEVYYLLGNSGNAKKEFQVVINDHPASEKAPDAILKLGMIYSDQGNYDRAYQEFRLLKKKYPDSQAAKMINHQLTTNETKDHAKGAASKKATPEETPMKI